MCPFAFHGIIHKTCVVCFSRMCDCVCFLSVCLLLWVSLCVSGCLRNLDWPFSSPLCVRMICCFSFHQSCLEVLVRHRVLFCRHIHLFLVALEKNNWHLPFAFAPRGWWVNSNRPSSAWRSVLGWMWGRYVIVWKIFSSPHWFSSPECGWKWSPVFSGKIFRPAFVSCSHSSRFGDEFSTPLFLFLQHMGCSYWSFRRFRLSV